jgi:type II secretory pathway predicted ATPase ExeA
MHLAFYGLQENPFNATPDPRFLYLTEGHREALAQLVYGVQEQKGFILLTGEVGTGKTTLLRALLERLDSTTAVAFVTNSMLPFDGILEYALEDFGIAKPGESHAQRLFTLQNFLIERRRSGQNTVLILDEAQNLGAETLEQIRLLSNFETATEKILQILLVGQPELTAKLELPGLRQLRQRIGLRCRISPLTREETHDYIRTRLRIAGTRDRGLFTERAIARIAAYSSGFPRVINTVCDHCLLIGYADQRQRIDRDIVDEAIEYLEQTDAALRNAWRRLLRRSATWLPRWGLLTGCGALVAVTSAYFALAPDMVQEALEASLSLFSSLTDSMRGLLTR